MPILTLEERIWMLEPKTIYCGVLPMIFILVIAIFIIPLKPASIEVEISDDNRKFRKVGTLSFTPQDIFREWNFVEDLSLNINGKQARYIRVTAKGPGACPEDHVRPGQESRVMFDEVIVK